MHIVLCNTGYPIKWTIDWAYSGAQNYIWEPPCLGSINKSLPIPPHTPLPPSILLGTQLAYCVHNVLRMCTMYYTCATLQCTTHVQITQMSKLARVFKPCAVQILYTNYSCWQAGAISEACFGGTEGNRHPQPSGSEIVFRKLLEIEQILWKLLEIKKIF